MEIPAIAVTIIFGVGTIAASSFQTGFAVISGIHYIENIKKSNRCSCKV